MLDKNNNAVIIITQPTNQTKITSANQLIISLILRYALEYAKKCQTDLQDIRYYFDILMHTENQLKHSHFLTS
jgi:hypothetical protein